MDDLTLLKNSMESVFKELGFKESIIGKYRYLVYGNCYCRVSYVKFLRGYVIEDAESYYEAENNVLEDGDCYLIEWGEEKIVNKLRNDILKYYLD